VPIRLIGSAALAALLAGAGVSSAQVARPAEPQQDKDGSAAPPAAQGGTTVHAPGATDQPEIARPAELTASDVADAPRPDAARNLVHDDRSGARHLLWVPRAILFVPKWGLWLAAAPVRGGLYSFEAYGLSERVRRLFSGDGPVTIYPSVAREAGHGLTYGVGAGVSHYVRANFLFGGEVREVYELQLKTHRLLGSEWELETAGQIHLLDDSYFFGIGNGDLEDAKVNTVIDARRNSTAVTTRFDQRIFRAELAAIWRPLRTLTLRPTSALIFKDFSPINGTGGGRVDVGMVYNTASLVGYDEGVSYSYNELRAIYDDRRSTNPFVSLAQPSRGWKVEGFAGYAHGFDQDPSRYVRYGLDIQRYFDLYLGDRILLLRAYLEGVTADIGEVPFTELPRLGGSRLARGYLRNRFRDREVTELTAEYKYPISRTLAAFVFVDEGAAWRKLTDFDPTELHPSYGGGIQIHTASLFLTRFLVGVGDDGFTFHLSFSPSSQVQLTAHQW
jgi:hypothetical protein